MVKLADGAKDNGTYLSDALPTSAEVVDFYPAAEHLKHAFEVAYGKNSPKARAQCETYRHVLCDEHDGVEKVIRAWVYLWLANRRSSGAHQQGRYTDQCRAVGR